MPASSQTDIVNSALALLGSSSRVASIDERGNIAAQLRDIWPTVRRGVLVAHPWNFAIRREHILPEQSEITGQQRFRLPPDCLRWLPSNGVGRDAFVGEQEGDFILSSSMMAILVRYIADVEEVGRWSAGFVDAMTFRIAYVMAEAVAASSGLRDRMNAGYDDALRRARRQDGLTTGRRRVVRLFPSGWYADRFGGDSFGANWPYGPCDEDV